MSFIPELPNRSGLKDILFINNLNGFRKIFNPGDYQLGRGLFKKGFEQIKFMLKK